MVSAPSARPRFPRPGWRCFRTRPTVSSAPKKSPPAKERESGVGSRESAARVPVPRNRYVIFLAIALVGFAADWATKEAVLDWLGAPAHFVDDARAENLARWRGDPSLPHRWWLINGRLGIETSLN